MITKSKTIFNELDEVPVYFPTLREIIKQSIITDFELLYDDFITISVKTSNSQKDIENMAFWKYKALSTSLKKYIEKENNNGENGEQPNVGEESKKLMANAKLSVPKMKTPKLK